jgi:pimeloyl-ACP methyl ester carboxylesterase
MTTSELLGTEHTVELPSGRVRYHERGTGAPVVFVHGVLVNSGLWRKVVPDIAEAGFRCLTPDWPLGGHRVPMPPNADLSPPGVARLIAEFLDELDLTDVTIVANDTGCAITQLLMTEHPARLGRIVLTPGDALDYFFPPMLSPLPKVVAVPGMSWLLTKAIQVPFIRRSPTVFGSVAKKPIPEDIWKSYTGPCAESPEIRRDLRRFLRGVHKRYTLAAADKFGDCKQPVLLIGAADDKFFPPRLWERLAQLLPDARRVVIDDSRTFVSEDQPAEVVRLVVDFLRSH